MSEYILYFAHMCGIKKRYIYPFLHFSFIFYGFSGDTLQLVIAWLRIFLL